MIQRLASSPGLLRRAAAFSSTIAATSTTSSFFSTTTPASSSIKIDEVGVVGLGLMGHGICQVAATCGSHGSIVAYEAENEFLIRGKERIVSSVDRLVSRGKMDRADADEALGKIRYTTDPSDLGTADLIVEAVVEDMNLKRSLYADLDRHCKSDAIFASNTSSLSISEMADVCGRPDRLVGVHFFNPAQIMKLVEVIYTPVTDPEVFDAAFDWVKALGKVPVRCGDNPGFIVNRLLIPNLVQAMLMLDREDATIRDIDTAMKLGAGHPMGPIQLADYVGLDTCLYILSGWTEKHPDEPSFVVPDCLREKVESGDLGRKTGRGFYVWDGDRCLDPVV